MKLCEVTLDFLDGQIRCERELGHEGKHSGLDLSDARLQHSRYYWGKSLKSVEVVRGDTKVPLPERSPGSTDPDKRVEPVLPPVEQLLKSLADYQDAIQKWEEAGRPCLPPPPPKEPERFGH